MEIEKRSEKNMKDDDELEMLLGEIPHATSAFNLQEMLNNATNHHHHHNNLVDHGYGHASCVTQRMSGHAHGHGHAHSHSNVHLRGDGDESLKRSYVFASSPVSGLSLQSGGSSSSLFSGGGRSHSDIESQSPPLVEDAKPHLIPGGGFCLDFKKANESNLVDYFDLSRNLSNMCIRDEREGVSVLPYGVQYCDQLPNGTAGSFEKYGASDSYRNSFSYRGGPNVSVPRKPINFEGEAGSALVQMPYDHQRAANLLGSRYSPSQDRMFCWSDSGNSATGPQFHRHNGVANNNFPMGFVVPPLDNQLVGNSLFYPSQSRKNLIEAGDSFYSSNMAHVAQLSPHFIEESLIHYQQLVSNGRNKVPLRVRVPRGSVEPPFGREDSLIIQGEGVNYAMARRGHNTKSFHHERRSQLDDHLHAAATQDDYQSPKMQYPLSRPAKFSSLAEAQGYIYHIAKDQQGCRFLQRMFDEGTAIDVQIIFNEIIDHAVELMMNPFGNYLMQKLLEVCNEGQRMHILFRVTEEPGELVRISLNTHGYVVHLVSLSFFGRSI